MDRYKSGRLNQYKNVLKELKNTFRKDDPTIAPRKRKELNRIKEEQRVIKGKIAEENAYLMELNRLEQEFNRL